MHTTNNSRFSSSRNEFIINPLSLQKLPGQRSSSKVLLSSASINTEYSENDEVLQGNGVAENNVGLTFDESYTPSSLSRNISSTNVPTLMDTSSPTGTATSTRGAGIGMILNQHTSQNHTVTMLMHTSPQNLLLLSSSSTTSTTPSLSGMTRNRSATLCVDTPRNLSYSNLQSALADLSTTQQQQLIVNSSAYSSFQPQPKDFPPPFLLEDQEASSSDADVGSSTGRKTNVDDESAFTMDVPPNKVKDTPTTISFPSAILSMSISAGSRLSLPLPSRRGRSGSVGGGENTSGLDTSTSSSSNNNNANLTFRSINPSSSSTSLVGLGLNNSNNSSSNILHTVHYNHHIPQAEAEAHTSNTNPCVHSTTMMMMSRNTPTPPPLPSTTTTTSSTDTTTTVSSPNPLVVFNQPLQTPKTRDRHATLAVMVQSHLSNSKRAAQYTPTGNANYHSHTSIAMKSLDLPVNGQRYERCCICLEYGIMAEESCCSLPRHTKCEKRHQACHLDNIKFRIPTSTPIIIGAVSSSSSGSTGGGTETMKQVHSSLSSSSSEVVLDLPCSVCKQTWKSVPPSDPFILMILQRLVANLKAGGRGAVGGAEIVVNEAPRPPYWKTVVEQAFGSKQAWKKITVWYLCCMIPVCLGGALMIPGISLLQPAVIAVILLASVGFTCLLRFLVCAMHVWNFRQLDDEIALEAANANTTTTIAHQQQHQVLDGAAGGLAAHQNITTTTTTTTAAAAAAATAAGIPVWASELSSYAAAKRESASGAANKGIVSAIRTSSSLSVFHWTTPKDIAFSALEEALACKKQQQLQQQQQQQQQLQK